MNTYSIQRLILNARLCTTDTLVGFVYSLHFNAKSGFIRVKQSLIASECQCTEQTVRRSLRALEKAGIFTSVRTGRSSIVIPVPEETGKGSGRVERRDRRDQTAAHTAIDRVKVSGIFGPFDTELSSKAEERFKALERMKL